MTSSHDGPDEARSRHLASFTFQGARDVTEEHDQQRLLFRQLSQHVSDTVAHSCAMLWLHFEHQVPAEQARGGREHLLCLMQALRATSQRCRTLAAQLAGLQDDTPPHLQDDP